MMKARRKKGFTMAELLIVVAIVGILVAISIPIFTAQLEKAREATDVANLRAAKAEAVAEFLMGNKDLGLGTWSDGAQTADVTVYYDATTGKLEKAAPSTKYGKGSGSSDGGTVDAGLNYTGTTDAVNKVIAITVTKNGECSFAWS